MPGKMSLTERRKAGAEWRRSLRFKGRVRWMSVKSEVHFLSRSSVTLRRDRLKHRVRQAFQFRLRGQYVGPLLFEKRTQ